MRNDMKNFDDSMFVKAVNPIDEKVEIDENAKQTFQ